MKAASTYPTQRDGVRLLVVDPRSSRLRSGRVTDLPRLLAPDDLLVVNDAATLPASLRGRDERGRAVEARLFAVDSRRRFRAVLLGAGDWRTRTEERPPPPQLAAGARLIFGSLQALVIDVVGRVVSLRFVDADGTRALDEAALWSALYREGRPVQYSHLEHALPLWAVQTGYATRPWAFEMPSAGRPLSWEILLGLRRRGVGWAAVTHAAGLSATGDPELDRALPLAERFDIPARTVQAIGETRRRRGRVVAVGTTVVRALEGAAETGRLRAGEGETTLRLTPSHRPRIVDGILTGIHSPEESHFQLLGAFAQPPLLEAAAGQATMENYLTHELGEAMLVLPGVLPRRAAVIGERDRRTLVAASARRCRL